MLPDYAKAEYLTKAQTESGYTPKTFYNLLIEANNAAYKQTSVQVEQIRIFNPHLRDHAFDHSLDYFGSSMMFSEVMKVEQLLIEILNNSEAKDTTKKILQAKTIALIHVYNLEQITDANCKEVAKKYNRNGGRDLYNNYTHFSSRANRMNPENTTVKTKNKIELIENVVPLLKKECKQKAIDELNVLKSKADSCK